MAEIQINLPDEIQEAANTVIKSAGLTISKAVRLFMVHIAADKSSPLDFFSPNADTLQAITEAGNGMLTPTTIDTIIADIEPARAELKST